MPGRVPYTDRANSIGALMLKGKKVLAPQRMGQPKLPVEWAALYKVEGPWHWYLRGTHMI